MRTKRNLVFSAFAAILLLCPTIHAQNAKSKSSGSVGQAGYKTGIGLRFGAEGGFTIKHFINDGRALEGLVSRGWGYGGFRITGLYEIQKPFPDVAGLDWFFGAGAHVGFYDGRYYGYYGYYNGGYYDKHGNWHPNGYHDYYTSIGIDLILGLEYQIPDIPLTVGIDIKPYIDLFGRTDHFADGALSLRYIFQ
jgi:hypothetical protein